MVDFRKAKGLAIMSFALCLGACTQTIISSYIQVNDGYISDPTRESLVERVYAKAEQLGGECELLSVERQYHTCSLKPNNPSLQIGIGYTPKGHYTISVTSTLGHWLPPSETDIISGKYVSDTQKDLEIWMLSLLPTEAVTHAMRSYVGYDVLQEF